MIELAGREGVGKVCSYKYACVRIDVVHLSGGFYTVRAVCEVIFIIRFDVYDLCVVVLYGHVAFIQSVGKGFCRYRVIVAAFVVELAFSARRRTVFISVIIDTRIRGIAHRVHVCFAVRIVVSSFKEVNSSEVESVYFRIQKFLYILEIIILTCGIRVSRLSHILIINFYRGGECLCLISRLISLVSGNLFVYRRRPTCKFVGIVCVGRRSRVRYLRSIITVMQSCVSKLFRRRSAF